MKEFDFVKIGSYQLDKGPLTKETTNRIKKLLVGKVIFKKKKKKKQRPPVITILQ